jgi:cytochrome c-type biogenesis protein CcmE
VARSKRSPARLVVALSIAALLTVFLIYTAVGGGSTRQFSVNEIAAQTGEFSVAGKVVGPIAGDARSDGGLRFALVDIQNPGKTLQVVYHGSKPDMFKVGRDVNATGELQRGTLVATGLTTKCPSKYTAEEKTPSASG